MSFKQRISDLIKTNPIFSFVADLINLTKPGILVLLLISTACPMVLASGGDVTLHQIFLALMGGALVSGSASTFNCIFDRDIDAIMNRTKNRPLAAGRISVFTAFVFATILAILGIGILAIYLNLLAAALALFGHLFYVLVYTIWLKRTTPQNIVIGGAAGAIPPLVGWAAVTGNIGWTAFLLFLVIFLWTPPHFWALALNKNSDYQKAGIPMLPVVSGEEKTFRQMMFYGLSLIPVSMALVIVDEQLGWFSMLSLIGINLVFCFKIYQLWLFSKTNPEKKVSKAWDVFGFSLIYLGLFFICIVVDSTLI
jgi:heme o synthase